MTATVTVAIWLWAAGVLGVPEALAIAMWEDRRIAMEEE